jgi:hypothetical protein
MWGENKDTQGSKPFLPTYLLLGSNWWM